MVHLLIKIAHIPTFCRTSKTSVTSDDAEKTMTGCANLVNLKLYCKHHVLDTYLSFSNTANNHNRVLYILSAV